jgi:drug/metabolite transporter (DMT)-like permease
VSSTKKVSDKYPPALLAFWGWIFTLLLHYPLSILFGEKQVAPHFDHAWLWLIVYSVINAAAFWLVIEGYRHVDASIGSLIGLSEIIFAIFFGVVIFHQKLTWSVAIGAVLILAAAMLPDIVNLIKGKRTVEVIEPVREL